MSISSSLYFIGPPSATRDACLEVDKKARAFDDVAAFARAEELSPGIVVIHQGGETAALELLRDLWDAGPGWTLAVADRGDPLTLRTLSLGLPAGPEALVQHVAGTVGTQVTLIDLREALIQIAKSRHDVNNPLTAALAETQILLMDADDDAETREALLTVQEQLRRIRDLVAATGHLRLPRS